MLLICARKSIIIFHYEHVSILFACFLSFPLKNEWCGLYDIYILIILGFLTLQRKLTASSTERCMYMKIRVYVCSVWYLKYIYTRCCRILNKPVTDFGF